jgi:hypothetical protein
MIEKRMRSDSMANEVVRAVCQIANEVKAAHVPVKRKPRHGYVLPLFAWLRAAKKKTSGSPVLYILQETDPPQKVGALLSRVSAAAEVVQRLSRNNPMTATQLQMLHESITCRYGGTDSRRNVDEWLQKSQFKELYAAPVRRATWSPRRLEVELLKYRAGVLSHMAHAPAVLTHPRMTDALLMAHLYSSIKSDFSSRI